MQGRENKSIDCKIFVWKSERNRPFGRNICTPIKEDNIKIDVREIGYSGVEWSVFIWRRMLLSGVFS
jgi:hypothetical protein